jgi:uncharacterized RDD family membrane protein YckC
MREDSYPGQRLGLPQAGAGSGARWGPRILALLIDWLVANLMALLVVGVGAWSSATPRGWAPLLLWFVLVALSTGLTGASPGQHLLGLRVVRLDLRPVGLWRGIVRTALIALVIPPLVFDPDRRGLHDLAVGTIAVVGPGRGRA